MPKHLAQSPFKRVVEFLHDHKLTLKKWLKNAFCENKINWSSNFQANDGFIKIKRTLNSDAKATL